MESETFWIQMAGIPMWVKPQNKELWYFFKKYRISPTKEDQKEFQLLMNEKAPLITSQEEIEREDSFKEGHFSQVYLESLAIYRKICHLLLEKNVLLFHCSALEIHGKAVLFTAKSGTGKSTHARLWRERFGKDVIMINDDKPLLKIGSDEVRVYGTPYAGKENLHTNRNAKVAAIVILHQAKKNHLEAVSAQKAYPLLLNQTYRRQDEIGMLQTMDLIGELARLPIYEFGCTISQDAVNMVYERLKGDGCL
ncbi:hypothetical protein [Negativibacillus massiliensis]|uniref:hypothetical protein n=1 Tax=Negativibacillus massiliensis TaxID=1871035 RepID=UPI003AF259A6